jgi:aminoglycoside phosphotransferase
VEEYRKEEERVARARLAGLRHALPRLEWDQAQFLVSDSNEVWRVGDVVLRVCWRGDRQRLLREVELVRALPASLRAPQVLDAGHTADVTWELARYVPGIAPDDAVLDLDDTRLRALTEQLAEILRGLHAWQPPGPVRRALDAREQAHANELSVNLLCLPVPRAMTLIEPASRLHYLDPALLRSVEARIGALAEIDPFTTHHETVVHGDAHFWNTIVDEQGIAALLDYEWCRFSPVDAELPIWLHVMRVHQLRRPGRPMPPILTWLRDAYPELFAAPDLEGRLWLYALVFHLQGVLVWPPDAPERDLVAEHHVHALRELVGRPPALPWDPR